VALIKCPDCGRDVSDAAPACPNCGRPTSVLPTSIPPPLPSPPWTTGFRSVPPPLPPLVGKAKKMNSVAVGSLVLVGLVGLTIIGAKTGPNVPPSASRPTAVLPVATESPAETADTPPDPQLELVKFSWHTEYGYAILEGQVKNVSSQPLRNVAALASFYEANGSFITSSHSLIDYNPVLPEQTSPFKVMARENPRRSKSIAHFATSTASSSKVRRGL
jgi:hypothetical protein